MRPVPTYTCMYVSTRVRTGTRIAISIYTSRTYTCLWHTGAGHVNGTGIPLFHIAMHMAILEYTRVLLKYRYSSTGSLQLHVYLQYKYNTLPRYGHTWYITTT